MIISIAILGVIGIAAWKDNWNLTYLFNEKVIPLEGILETEDGHISLFPKEMVLNHKGIILKLDYKVAEELKEKDFYINAFNLPSLMLEKNPNDNNRIGSPVFAPGERALYKDLKTDGDSFYLEYFYAFKDLDYKEGDTLQLNFYSANFDKKVNQKFAIELDTWKTIAIDDLAEYKIYITRQKDDVMRIENKLRYKLGDSMRIHDSVISVVGDQEMKIRGGGGTGNGSGNYYSFSGTYAVDPFFWEGDYYVDLYSLSIDIGPYYEEYPRLILIE